MSGQTNVVAVPVGYVPRHAEATVRESGTRVATFRADMPTLLAAVQSGEVQDISALAPYVTVCQHGTVIPARTAHLAWVARVAIARHCDGCNRHRGTLPAARAIAASAAENARMRAFEVNAR